MAVGTVGAGEPILDPITAFGATQLHLPGGSKSHLRYGVPTYHQALGQKWRFEVSDFPKTE